MIEGLDRILMESTAEELAPLHDLLERLVGGTRVQAGVVREEKLAPSVYRLRFALDRRSLSLVIKGLDPEVARRNALVAERWLPAVGLAEHAPPLLGVAAESNGRKVWHVYEDLGDWVLDETAPAPDLVMVAVEMIVEVHRRFADHGLLGECRFRGKDLGSHFFASNVRDAIRILTSLRPPLVELAPDRAALKERLLERLYRLLDEEASRTRAMKELGGPDTLLHGDLWPKNVVVISDGSRARARLVDWDRAGVGPVSYDLSTFLSRFPRSDRAWIFGLYERSLRRSGWRLPNPQELDLLFDTAERARLANRVVWSGISALESRAEWAFEELRRLDTWFETLEPILPGREPEDTPPESV